MKNILKIRKDIIIGCVKKEFKQILRDPKMKGILFAAPIMMLIIFGYAANTDVREVKIAVLDSDRSTESRALTEKIFSSGYFKPYQFVTTPKEAEKLIDKGECEAYVSIEYNFSKNINKSQAPSVQVVLDGTDPNRAMIIFNYLRMIITDYSFELLAKSQKASAMLSRPVNNIMPIDIKQRVFFNENLESRVFFLPGLLCLLLGLITTMLTSMAIVKEREAGTMEQLIVSPIRPLEFIAGKSLPFAIIGFFDTIVITLLIIIWFGIPFRGSLIFLIVSGLFYIIANLGIGIYISTISRTQQQAMLSTFLFFIPAILFSGFVFPISSMPEIIRVVTYLDPMRYFITILRGVFLKGTGIYNLWMEISCLFTLGMIFISLSVRRFARGFE